MLMKPEFDAFAETYRTVQTKHLQPTGENSEYFAQLKADKLVEWLILYKKNNPTMLLDFGCGDGNMTEYVAHLLPTTKIYGVDPSSESVELAKKRLPNASFYTSGPTLPFFENNMFDVIYAAGVFHHIPFNEHKEYLDELHRILKPNGLLILFELNPWNPGTSYIFHTHPMEKNAKMLTPHYAKRLTNSYGHKDTIFYCFFPHALKALRPLEKYLTNIPLGGLYGTILQK